VRNLLAVSKRCASANLRPRKDMLPVRAGFLPPAPPLSGNPISPVPA